MAAQSAVLRGREDQWSVLSASTSTTPFERSVHTLCRIKLSHKHNASIPAAAVPLWAGRGVSRGTVLGERTGSFGGVNEAVINTQSTQWPVRESVCSCPIGPGLAQPGSAGTSGAAGPDKVYLAKPRVSHTYSLTVQWKSLSRAVNRPPVFSTVFSPLWNGNLGFRHIAPGSSSGCLQHQDARIESLGGGGTLRSHKANF